MKLKRPLQNHSLQFYFKSNDCRSPFKSLPPVFLQIEYYYRPALSRIAYEDCFYIGCFNLRCREQGLKALLSDLQIGFIQAPQENAESVFLKIYAFC